MFPLSAVVERAVVQVAVQVLVGADRQLPEWSLASADLEVLVGSELASVEQVAELEHSEPVRVLRLLLG